MAETPIIAPADRACATSRPRRRPRAGASSTALLAMFERWGFARVITPAFEYEDVLALGLGDAARAATIRFVEPSSGEVVALRPDITPQIARLIATRFRDEPGPVRLCYEGTVVRLERGARGQRELMQAGVELAGVRRPRRRRRGDRARPSRRWPRSGCRGRPSISATWASRARCCPRWRFPDAALDGGAPLHRQARRRRARRACCERRAARSAAIAFARLLPELSGAPAVLDDAPRAGAQRRHQARAGRAGRHRRRGRAAASSTRACTSISARCAASTTTRASAFRRSSRAPPTRCCRAAATTICSARYGRPSPAVGFAVDVEAVAGRWRPERRSGDRSVDRQRAKCRQGNDHMAVVVVVGAQWGDEGKGKVVDLLTERARCVVRWAAAPTPATRSSSTARSTSRT